MEHVWTAMENSEGKKLAEEIRDLERSRTAIMIEKCCASNAPSVACPKPRRRNGRYYEGHNELKVESELLDFISSKASPPYFSGSPPIRTANPLCQDPNFRDQMFTQAIAVVGQTAEFDGPVYDPLPG